jgi:hypothetical protein
MRPLKNENTTERDEQRGGVMTDINRQKQHPTRTRVVENGEDLLAEVDRMFEENEKGLDPNNPEDAKLLQLSKDFRMNIKRTLIEGGYYDKNKRNKTGANSQLKRGLND